MSDSDRTRQPHPCWSHSLHFRVKGQTAAEIEGQAYQTAATFFGLLPGDVIPQWLKVQITTDTETKAQTVNGQVVLQTFEASVTASRDSNKWREYLESL